MFLPTQNPDFPHKISWMPTVDVIICGTEDNAGREQGHTGELYAECDWETAMEKKAWSKPYDDCFSAAGSLYPPKYLVSTWFSADSPDLAILGQGHHKTWSSTSCQKDTLQQLLSFSVNYLFFIKLFCVQNQIIPETHGRYVTCRFAKEKKEILGLLINPIQSLIQSTTDNNSA